MVKKGQNSVYVVIEWPHILSSTEYAVVDMTCRKARLFLCIELLGETGSSRIHSNS